MAQIVLGQKQSAHERTHIWKWKCFQTGAHLCLLVNNYVEGCFATSQMREDKLRVTNSHLKYYVSTS